MNFKIVKESSLSGAKATIYSIILQEDEKTSTTLLDHFIIENQKAYGKEINDILGRLLVMGQKTGARDNYFKEWEGKPGDGVCALFDDPEKQLRLYCIRFGNSVLIVGGGGHKPKSLRALQESPKLEQENNYMRIISSLISKRIREKEITWSEDELELLGDFNFYEDE